MAARAESIPGAQRPTILVTGGTGFIGRHTLAELVQRGFDVHAVSRADRLLPAGVSLHRHDLLSPGDVEEVVQRVRPTHLLHLAWSIVPGQVFNSHENLHWLEASSALLRYFAAAGGSRAVMAGTLSEYGPSDGPCHEYETPLAPDTLYAVSKDALRRVALAMGEEAGLSVAWPRIFFAYGPSEHPARLVSSVTRNLLLGEEAPCSHARQMRDYLYAPDIAAALVAVLDSEAEGPVNVGSGKAVALREIIDRLAEEVGRPELLRFGAVTPRPHEPPVVVADVARLREEVGWTPPHSLQEGLRLTVDWWRAELGLPRA